MIVSLEQLNTWLKSREDECLEFKEAKTQYDSEKLTKYCVALANEGGGHLVLGVTDKMPWRVVGTRAFKDLAKLGRGQSQRVRLNIAAGELAHPDGRVVVIAVPPRPIGMPMEYKGAYWMRRGGDLVPMHIEDNRADGSPIGDLMQVLPALSRNQIWVLLRVLRGCMKTPDVIPAKAGIHSAIVDSSMDSRFRGNDEKEGSRVFRHPLRRDGKAFVKGRTRSARWFPTEDNADGEI